MTIRRLETRLKDHKVVSCFKGFTDRSAVVEHAWAQQHPIKWRETTVLNHVRRNMELLLKESFTYQKQSMTHLSHFNRVEETKFLPSESERVLSKTRPPSHEVADDRL